jgi:acetoin utilization deacetylase AcuC-like enzyme
MPLPIVFHPHYILPLRAGHAFPMSKYGYLREMLVARRILPASGGFVSPAPLPAARIATIHPADYVARVRDAALAPEEIRRIGLPATAELARRAFLAASGTVLAARLALEAGIALNMAGGSHHAGPEGGAGYCVFNDVALAARVLLDEGRVGRIAVLDADVHQGDGTARIFAGEARVFTVSIHAARNYPLRKARSDLDLALPDATGDAAYLAALEGALATLDAVAADLVFYNAGVDPHEDDRLGRLALSDAGLRARDAAVIGWARSRGYPLVAVLGGGYGPDPAIIAARHAILFEEAARATGA